MTETPKLPRRIEWAGPEGWIVWADEDGVHVRTTRGECLEMPDVERLFSLWTHARGAMRDGRVSTPAPPTREEIREGDYRRVEEYAARRAIKAVTRELTPEADVTPF